MTSTWNSQVRVFRYGTNGIAQSVGVDSFKSVADDLQDKAVKKTTSQVSNFNNLQYISSQTEGRKMDARKEDTTDKPEFFKCLRESNDDRSIQFVKAVTDSD